MANFLTCEGGKRSKSQTTWVGELLLHLGESPGDWRISPGWIGSGALCSLRCAGANKQVCTMQLSSMHRAGVPRGHSIHGSHSCGNNWMALLLELWAQTQLTCHCLWLKEAARIAAITWSSQSPGVGSCICKTKAGDRQFLTQERLRHEWMTWYLNKTLKVGFHPAVHFGLDKWAFTYRFFFPTALSRALQWIKPG